MKYDAYTLQVFQQVLEDIESSTILYERGICCVIADYLPYDENGAYQKLLEWMHQKYIPHKTMNDYWWPARSSAGSIALAKAREDRIAFLQRIIEDLMCGGPA